MLSVYCVAWFTSHSQKCYIAKSSIVFVIPCSLITASNCLLISNHTYDATLIILEGLRPIPTILLHYVTVHCCGVYLCCLYCVKTVHSIECYVLHPGPRTNISYYVFTADYNKVPLTLIISCQTPQAFLYKAIFGVKTKSCKSEFILLIKTKPKNKASFWKRAQSLSLKRTSRCCLKHPVVMWFIYPIHTSARWERKRKKWWVGGKKRQANACSGPRWPSPDRAWEGGEKLSGRSWKREILTFKRRAPYLCGCWPARSTGVAAWWWLFGSWALQPCSKAICPNTSHRP